MPTKLPRQRTPYYDSELIMTKPAPRTESCWAMALGINTLLSACEDEACLTRRQKRLLEVAPLLATLKTEIYGHDTPVYLEDDSSAAQALHDKFVQLENRLTRLSAMNT